MVSLYSWLFKEFDATNALEDATQNFNIDKTRFCLSPSVGKVLSQRIEKKCFCLQDQNNSVGLHFTNNDHLPPQEDKSYNGQEIFLWLLLYCKKEWISLQWFQLLAPSKHYTFHAASYMSVLVLWAKFVREWETVQSQYVAQANFTQIIMSLYQKYLSTKYIRSGFAKSGLLPHYSERIMRQTQGDHRKVKAAHKKTWLNNF